MSYEKHTNGIANRRPVANPTAQSPKWSGTRDSIGKVEGSPALNGSSARWKGNRVDGREDNSHSKEVVATPVKAFLNSNITPRSGLRKARVESASSTPSGTPDGVSSHSRPVSSDVRATSGIGLRVSTAGRSSRAGSVISDGPDSSVSSRPSLLERNNLTTRATTPESAPRFFHANDVRAYVSTRNEEFLPQVPGHLPSNDKRYPNGTTSSIRNSPPSDEQRPQFFYANDLSESNQSPPGVSNNGCVNRPSLQTIYSEYAAPSPPRAPSPLKEGVLHRKLSMSRASPRSHTRIVSNGRIELKSPETTSGRGNIARRSSLNTPAKPRINTHTRSSSVHSLGPTPSRRSSIALSQTSPSERTRTRTMSVSAANGALPHCVKPASETPELPTPKLPSQPQSPTRPQAVGQSKIDQMNELAANARRERKVLDLEISNSSLLAINRTLEREMRKQNAELRRFRRLSRSGRLSVAPASCSASGKISMTSETVDDPNDDLSPLDCDENEHNAKDFFSDHSSPASSPPFSPTARASHARFQDPKRIELDLAAHRALLLDGQKLNQSIKRCLLNSESLLASGKQALEYQACAPEPESLGARVLTPEEIEGSILAQGQGLLSPSLGAGSNPWERDLGSMGSLDGGFETPDYSKWGPSTEVLTPFAEGTIELALDRPEKAVTARDSLDAQSKDSNPLLRALDGQSRRASEIASLDGVDDSLDSSTLEYESNDEEIPARPESSGVDNASPTKMMFSMSPPDLKGNVPGNRGSMQNLGHYLQAFSIFGTSQQT